MSLQTFKTTVEGGVEVTRRSAYSGELHTRLIPCTMEQIQLWERGMLIQDALPDVPAEDREFLISGVTPEEWHKLTANN
jgi:hypothetical protein